MVSADTGQSIQTVADVGYPAGISSSSGSRLRVYPQGYESSAVQIHADTSNKGIYRRTIRKNGYKNAQIQKNGYKYISYIHETFGLSGTRIEFGKSMPRLDYTQPEAVMTQDTLRSKPRLDVKRPIKSQRDLYSVRNKKSRIVKNRKIIPGGYNIAMRWQPRCLEIWARE
ncbi:hypothetical protein [Blautia producta]|nr:hypothetical protein [Blautia producta]